MTDSPNFSSLRTSDFDYDLPPERIAQTPVEPRHDSRLLVLNRTDGSLAHRRFHDVGEYLRAGDILVLNQTRVIPARIFAHKLPGGGRVELLMVRRVDELTWEALGGGKGLRVGRELDLEEGPHAVITGELAGPLRLVRFSEPIEPYLERVGQMPLPPYIHTALADPERYQTVYARQRGSAAAPTAGLHFTPELLDRLTGLGVGLAFVTLHVGLDTFAPVNEENPHEHQIHTEWCEVSAETAAQIQRARDNGGRVVAVGTTSVRTLESAARQAAPGQVVGPYSGPTDLFILPGYQFKAVDAMITNFHLPRSTLLMLVSSFTGRESILKAYTEAVRLGYRFYSFGDAMLLL